MNYFRVYVNFTDYIPIDEPELEKALYAFQEGLPVVFECGAVTRIDRIVPDFNRAMGFNPAWNLNADDYNQIDREGLPRKHKEAIGVAKERIAYLIEDNKRELIGKNVPIPELDNSKTSPKISENLNGPKQDD